MLSKDSIQIKKRREKSTTEHIDLNPIFHRSIYRIPPFSALFLPPAVGWGPGAGAEGAPEVLSQGQWESNAMSPPTSLISPREHFTISRHHEKARDSVFWEKHHIHMTFIILHGYNCFISYCCYFLTVPNLKIKHYQRFACIGKPQYICKVWYNLLVSGTHWESWKLFPEDGEGTTVVIYQYTLLQNQSLSLNSFFILRISKILTLNSIPWLSISLNSTTMSK